MRHLLPAVLEQDLAAIIEKASWLKGQQSLFWRMQLDVMDGTFTQGKTFHDARALPELGVDSEVHLMVMHPELVLRGWLKHPNIKRVIVHTESTANLPSLITQVHLAGKEIALACNPDTPSRIFEEYIDLIDGILLLAVVPGKQGQSMNSDVLEKAKELARRAPQLPLCIDGGVNGDTLDRVLEAGFTDIVVGSGIWRAASPETALKSLYTKISTTSTN